MLHTRPIAAHGLPPHDDESLPEAGQSEQVTGSLERVTLDGPDQDVLIAQVREVAFPIALRGYDRESVDAYVKRVNRLIADLAASRSPEAAIRRALDKVGEETSGILQRAQQTANEITERSRASADDRVREAERQARELTIKAEDRVRELEADYGAIWARRDQLLEEVRELAERLLATADEPADRFPTQEDEAGDARGDTASFPRLEAPSAGAPAETSVDADGAEDLEDESTTTSLEAREPAVGPPPGATREPAVGPWPGSPAGSGDDEAEQEGLSRATADADAAEEPAAGASTGSDEIDFADAPDDEVRDFERRTADSPSGDPRSS